MNQILADFGLVTVGDAQAFAVISPDDTYRYILGRVWDQNRPLWAFCMINPSKARGSITVNGERKVIDDPTIRKCTGFAKQGCAGGFLVVNAFAYSATYPKELVRAKQLAGIDICGAHNATAAAWALSRTDRHIVAWGKVPPTLRSAVAESEAAVRFVNSAPDCFGLNGDKSPKHPLMLSYATPIVSFVGSGGIA